MGRRIDTGVAATSPQDQLQPNQTRPLYLGPRKQSSGDDYLGRLVKYIPAEIIGLYLATSRAIPTDAGKHQNEVGLWFVFGVTFAFTPIYMYAATSSRKRNPLFSQVTLATIAFPVWVFAIGGPFESLSWYKGWESSIILIFVTVALGLYRPKAGS